MTRDYMGRAEIEAERKEKRPRRDPPVKICLQCYMLHPIARRICFACGFEFYPPRKPAK